MARNPDRAEVAKEMPARRKDNDRSQDKVKRRLRAMHGDMLEEDRA